MKKNYFVDADKFEKRNVHYGGSLANIISFITDNKDLISSGVQAVGSTISAGKNIKEAAKTPEDYKKSDKELIEEMKVERVYNDLQDLKNLNKVKVDRVYKNLKKIKSGKGFKII
jgi:hypothetical protein